MNTCMDSKVEFHPLDLLRIHKMSALTQNSLYNSIGADKYPCQSSTIQSNTIISKVHLPDWVTTPLLRRCAQPTSVESAQN